MLELLRRWFPHCRPSERGGKWTVYVPIKPRKNWQPNDFHDHMSSGRVKRLSEAFDTPDEALKDALIKHGKWESGTANGLVFLENTFEKAWVKGTVDGRFICL